MGNLSLVLQSPDASREKTVHRAGVALESTRIMMRMILDLLDISRLEESHMTLNREAVSLAAVAATCLTETGGLVTRGSIQIREEFPQGLPEAWVDRGLIDRVVANLLSNAIKHTPEGGTITVGARRNAAEETLELYVRDTGEGIPEAYHLVIFEKFCQADAKKFGLKSDRGLGLTFCKMAVEAHGGRIWVTSALGQGSTFTIALPIAMPVDVAGGDGCMEQQHLGSRLAR